MIEEDIIAVEKRRETCGLAVEISLPMRVGKGRVVKVVRLYHEWENQ